MRVCLCCQRRRYPKRRSLRSELIGVRRYALLRVARSRVYVPALRVRRASASVQYARPGDSRRCRPGVRAARWNAREAARCA